LHRDLLRLRREDPVIAAQEVRCIDGATLAEFAFVMRWYSDEYGDRLLLVNLDREQVLAPAPEPRGYIGRRTDHAQQLPSVGRNPVKCAHNHFWRKSMGRLENRIAIVTGAARGIGACVAQLFVQEGARVMLADVRDELGSTLAAQLGAQAAYVHLDVGVEADWVAALEATQQRFGAPTVLVNNAGIFRTQPIESLSMEAYMEVIRTNQIGVFLGMRSCIAPMREAGGGAMVNISSVQGLEGMTNGLAYAASKFAVTGMTKTAAIELAKHRIRVNSVHPGPIATMLVAESHGTTDIAAATAHEPGVPVKRWGQPEEIARLVLYLASDESSYSTGGAFLADGGLTAGLMYE
jgi:3alpha(or 20beta)-hydroxysteroid dehydrogenase